MGTAALEAVIMARCRQFHARYGSHAITVAVQRGRARDVELLVDGRQVGFIRERAGDVVMLAGVIVDDPPQFFHVRIEHLRQRSHGPICTALFGRTEQAMVQRTTP
ncbi:hypothetical protein [Streptacidiphilus sp. P02-A3a]|uniref:hypothetical protein n=1 Tax=Streptacidiphilus sp. P02-A3a TaxID=2704468 RepID=UPI0015FC9DF8|nr:hypothetical protein [Streptacidiphilus sp. P02-A3a]QMU69118.1 hypothetical protein GXP74_13555 [Streptacidiphilus sp. P02-A3a]